MFNKGDHLGGLSPQARAEALSKILYPSDDTASGRELRLRQEYFFVSASLQDLVRRHTRTFGSIYTLPERAAIHSTITSERRHRRADAHPHRPLQRSVGRGLEDHLQTFSHSNHTLLPEALESWPVPLFERLLPRHLEIIYAINARHLENARRTGPLDPDLLTEISLIDESDGRRVRMGHLAFVGSHRVNGVSALHTELMRTSVFSELHRLYPDRIINKTNGMSFRRWLHQANPGLIRLLCEACGPVVLDDPAALGRLAEQADDGVLQERLAAVKRANKVVLSRIVRERLGLQIDPSALFDVQIKRIHEYKRQLLNILDAIARYRAIRADPDPRLGSPCQDIFWKGRTELRASQAYHQSSPMTSPMSSTTIRWWEIG